ncbi:mannosyltransferase [Neonectria punicea]|uniref:Mannosyltransferase n=1 Tax=Neonectria punicea TaxID=979145 RepID=A0ABR1GXS7_9HYPO
MPSLKSLLLWGFVSLASSPVLASRSLPRDAIADPLMRFDSGGISLSPRKDKDKPKTPKYFNEAGGTLELGHYDKRYFHDKVPYAQHRFVLRDLARSYLSTMNSFGVETWLAHGTLLGWWWNGQIMPWDYDLDVQLTNTSMLWLGENLNRTEHVYNYTNPETGDLVSNSYLLDVNPHHVDLDRGDGMNIIDARWIDQSNGMYIDLTVLREREVDRPGIWSCKNKHRYKSQDLWPMRVTEFEGVKARIPYNFEMILIDEYQTKSLVTEEWQGHHWNRDIKQWVKMDPEEEAQRHQEAIERKKQELRARPSPGAEVS